MNRVGRRLRPLLPSAADYRDLRRTWRGDLLAGLTVGIVALPLALAFGVASGAGAEAGLVTAIVAGLVAAVFGGSHLQVSGPTGAMVVILGPIVAVHGAGAVPVVALMAGGILLVAGALRLGRTVSYIPWPVIEGFTLGIATIIFLQQIPAALGESPVVGGNAVVVAVRSLSLVAWPTVAWSLGAVAVVVVVMTLAPRIHARIPASLIGIALVTLIAGLVRSPLPTIGTLPPALPLPSVPDVDLALLQALAGPALAVAALAAIESLLSARVAAGMSDQGLYDADRELVGQGLASIASGFFGGMPATGAIARTAVNIRAGGRTRLSAVVHALVLLAVVSFGALLVSGIPQAALAAVLMVTAVRMASPSSIRRVLFSTKSDAAVFVITAVVTVSFDLIIAVGIGIVVAAFFALRRFAQSGGVSREPLPGPSQDDDDRIALFRIDGALFFGAADRVLASVTSIDDVSVVILRLSQLQALDATGASVITEMVKRLERRGVTVLIKGLTPEHLRVATRVGVIASLRHQNHLFDDLDSAVEHARSHVARSLTA